ncbi:hypothetical protein MHK_008970, partial [Candidatus Magnetomorum sp. HK-1]
YSIGYIGINFHAVISEYKKIDIDNKIIPVKKRNQMPFSDDGNIVHLRSKPKTLSKDDIKAIIKKYR